MYKTTTYFFRYDLDWKKFVKLLDNKYEGVSNVSVINHACSNGAEAFSLASKLIKELGEKANKFFPIIARDIDSQNIELAKRNKLETSIFEIIDSRRHLRNKFDDFFEVNDEPHIFKYTSQRIILPKPILSEKIDFAQSDIFEDIEKLPTSNVVLLCRNFWPYLTPEKREELVQKIVSHFDSSCLFVTGEYDRIGFNNFNVSKLFKSHNIIGTKVKDVWQKQQ